MIYPIPVTITIKVYITQDRKVLYCKVDSPQRIRGIIPPDNIDQVFSDNNYWNLVNVYFEDLLDYQRIGAVEIQRLIYTQNTYNVVLRGLEGQIVDRRNNVLGSMTFEDIHSFVRSSLRVLSNTEIQDPDEFLNPEENIISTVRIFRLGERALYSNEGNNENNTLTFLRPDTYILNIIVPALEDQENVIRGSEQGESIGNILFRRRRAPQRITNEVTFEITVENMFGNVSIPVVFRGSETLQALHNMLSNSSGNMPIPANTQGNEAEQFRQERLSVNQWVMTHISTLRNIVISCVISNNIVRSNPNSETYRSDLR